MNESDYVVIRASADLPAGFLPPGIEGRWYDRAYLSIGYGRFDGAVAVPTGRFEVRESDLAVAEVYEVQP